MYSCCTAVALYCCYTHLYNPTVRPAPLFFNFDGRQKREFKSPHLLFFCCTAVLCTSSVPLYTHGGWVNVLAYILPAPLAYQSVHFRYKSVHSRSQRTTNKMVSGASTPMYVLYGAAAGWGGHSAWKLGHAAALSEIGGLGMPSSLARRRPLALSLAPRRSPAVTRPPPVLLDVHSSTSRY